MAERDLSTVEQVMKPVMRAVRRLDRGRAVSGFRTGEVSEMAGSGGSWRLRGRRSVLAALTALAVPLAVMGPAAPSEAQTTTLTVATNGTDSATCGPVTPCLTIGAAVANAKSGDTIAVEAGTYTVTSPIVVGTSLTFDASGSVLTGSGPIFELYDASTHAPVGGVTIKGFTFQNVAGSGYNGVITVPGYGANDVVIENDTFSNITDEAVGDHANPGLSSGWTVEDNTVDGVTNPKRSGFWFGNLSNSTVQNNTISNTGYAGMIFDGANTVTISKNSISDVPAHGIEVGYTPGLTSPSDGVTISGNAVSNANTGLTSDFGGIDIYPSQDDISITGNNITGSFNGIDVRDVAGAVGSGVTVTDNNLSGNSNSGVQNAAPSGGTLSASGNWWGCAGGPGSPGCTTTLGTVTSTSPLTSPVVLTNTGAPVPFTGGGGGYGGAPITPTTPTPTPTPTPVAVTVGAAGGALVTSDGVFSMTVPKGALSGGETLNLAESSTPPSNLPPDTVAASPVIKLTGTQLSAPAAATIKYTAAALRGLSPQRLSLYTENVNAGWNFVPSAADANTGTVKAYVPGPGTMVVLADTQTFSDVPSTYWARPYIDAMLGAGVVNGFPNGTFQPDGALTRADFVKMLAVALGLPSGTGGTPFTDVPANAWFAPYVSAAVQAGLVKGLTATTFGPNQTVTREEVAVLLARALKLTGTSTLTFKDGAQIASWARADVAAAVAAGYISGFPNGTFQPAGATTRAQAAKVLALAVGHMAP